MRSALSRDSLLGPDPQLPEFAVDILDMWRTKRLQADDLYCLQQPDQPSAQFHRQVLELGFDGGNSQDGGEISDQYTSWPRHPPAEQLAPCLDRRPFLALVL